jgi:hypothetical protein
MSVLISQGKWWADVSSLTEVADSGVGGSVGTDAAVSSKLEFDGVSAVGAAGEEGEPSASSSVICSASANAWGIACSISADVRCAVISSNSSEG